MPLESWIQHSGVNEFLYDWQTVIAGFVALVAALITVWVTLRVRATSFPSRGGCAPQVSRRRASTANRQSVRRLL